MSVQPGTVRPHGIPPQAQDHVAGASALRCLRGLLRAGPGWCSFFPFPVHACLPVVFPNKQNSNADGDARRSFISNGVSMVNSCKFHSCILSCGSTDRMLVRGPYDVVNLSVRLFFFLEHA